MSTEEPDSLPALRRYNLTFSLKNGGWIRGEFTNHDFIGWCETAEMEQTRELTNWSDYVWRCMKNNPEPLFAGVNTVVSVHDPSQIVGFVIEPVMGRRR